MLWFCHLCCHCRADSDATAMFAALLRGRHHHCRILCCAVLCYAANRCCCCYQYEPHKQVRPPGVSPTHHPPAATNGGDTGHSVPAAAVWSAQLSGVSLDAVLSAVWYCCAVYSQYSLCIVWTEDFEPTDVSGQTGAEVQLCMLQIWQEPQLCFQKLLSDAVIYLAVLAAAPKPDL